MYHHLPPRGCSGSLHLDLNREGGGRKGGRGRRGLYLASFSPLQLQNSGQHHETLGKHSEAHEWPCLKQAVSKLRQATKAGGMAQLGEPLPRRHEALVSIYCTTQTRGMDAVETRSSLTCWVQGQPLCEPALVQISRTNRKLNVVVCTPVYGEMRGKDRRIPRSLLATKRPYFKHSPRQGLASKVVPLIVICSPWYIHTCNHIQECTHTH